MKRRMRGSLIGLPESSTTISIFGCSSASSIGSSSILLLVTVSSRSCWHLARSGERRVIWLSAAERVRRCSPPGTGRASRRLRSRLSEVRFSSCSSTFAHVSSFWLSASTSSAWHCASSAGRAVSLLLTASSTRSFVSSPICGGSDVSPHCETMRLVSPESSLSSGGSCASAALSTRMRRALSVMHHQSAGSTAEQSRAMVSSRPFVSITTCTSGQTALGAVPSVASTWSRSLIRASNTATSRSACLLASS
mmetsp:Transcript_27284/g.63850  ORF Transcript_27284/g.63850 Transcript_27284/m.63850 type:complete len:251 (+) Transcript_27284:423-1175(+)